MPARAEMMGGFGWAVVLPYKALPDSKTKEAFFKWEFQKMPGTNTYLLKDTSTECRVLAESIADLYNAENY
jgi:hypothetical protein